MILQSRYKYKQLLEAEDDETKKKKEEEETEEPEEKKSEEKPNEEEQDDDTDEEITKDDDFGSNDVGGEFSDGAADNLGSDGSEEETPGEETETGGTEETTDDTTGSEDTSTDDIETGGSDDLGGGSDETSTDDTTGDGEMTDDTTEQSEENTETIRSLLEIFKEMYINAEDYITNIKGIRITTREQHELYDNILSSLETNRNNLYIYICNTYKEKTFLQNQEMMYKFQASFEIILEMIQKLRELVDNQETNN